MPGRRALVAGLHAFRSGLIALLLVVGLPARATSLLEEESRIEAQVRTQVLDLVRGLVGEHYFATAQIQAKLKRPGEASKTEARRPASTANEDSILTFAPDAWDDTPVGVAEGFEVASLSVELFLDSRIPTTSRTAIAQATRDALRKYPVQIRTQFLNRVPDPQLSTAETKSDASRAPASTPEKEASGAPTSKPVDPVERFSLIALALAGFAGFALLGFFLSKGLGGLADSLKFVAQQLPSMGRREKPRAESAPEAAAPRAPTPEGSDRPALGMALRMLDRNQRSFREILEKKPVLLMKSLSMERDLDLAHLRILGPMLQDAEKQKLRTLLGSRSARVSSLDGQARPTPSESAAWLSDIVGKTLALELSGNSRMLAMLGTEDAQTLLRLTPKDVELFLRTPQLFSDGKVWRTFVELVPESLLEDVLRRATPEQFRAALSPQALEEKEYRAYIDKTLNLIRNSLRQAGPAYGPGPEETALLEDKILPAFLASIQAMSLPEESRRIDEALAQNPRLGELLHKRYWPVATLRRVPARDLKAWLVALDNRVLAALLFFCDMDLQRECLGLLPEGTKKVIAVSELSRLQATPMDEARTTELSSMVREEIQHLKGLWLQGDFSLNSNGGVPASGNLAA